MNIYANAFRLSIGILCIFLGFRFTYYSDRSGNINNKRLEFLLGFIGWLFLTFGIGCCFIISL